MGDEGIYKMIEVIGVSTESFSTAVRNAVKEASKTLKGLTWFEVIESSGKIENGAVAQYQVKLKVAFKLMK